MTIIRIGKRKRRGFTLIDNHPIEDAGLKWETLGLLTYLLSKPEGWEVNVKHLWKLHRGAGRDKIYRMLKELEEAGYFRSERIRCSDGTFYWTKTVYEEPQIYSETKPNVEDSPLPDFQEVDGPPLPEKPDTDFQEVDTYYIANTDVVNSTLGIDIQQQQDHIKDRTRANGEFAVVVAEKDTSSGKNSLSEKPVAQNAEDSFSLDDAFHMTGIKNPTAQRIPTTWEKATGRALTPEDVLAWHFYREAENFNLPVGRQLRPAFVIARLEAGEPADEAFYDQAREFLLENSVEPDIQETPSETPEELKARELERTLEPFLPKLADVGPQALDETRASLLDIARELASRGISADEVRDLHLYLTYTGQPLPQPEMVAAGLADAGEAFRAWRERKAEAEQLWRRITTSLSVGAPASAVGRIMQRATPVDLNGSLVVMAESDLEVYFTRVWPRQGSHILSQTDYPEDLPIQFIPQSRS